MFFTVDSPANLLNPVDLETFRALWFLKESLIILKFKHYYLFIYLFW